MIVRTIRSMFGILTVAAAPALCFFAFATVSIEGRAQAPDFDPCRVMRPDPVTRLMVSVCGPTGRRTPAPVAPPAAPIPAEPASVPPPLAPAPSVQAAPALVPTAPPQQNIVEMLPPQPDSQIVVRIACSSEKTRWVNAAKAEYERQAKAVLNGKNVRIVVESIGSVESAIAIGEGRLENQRAQYQLWLPASSFFVPIAASRFRGILFRSQDPLVYSPLVFLTWEDAQASIDQLSQQRPMSASGVLDIMRQEVRGRRGLVTPALPGQTESWYRVGASDPTRSSSGALMLVMMAYEHFSPLRPRFALESNDLGDTSFQALLAQAKLNFDLLAPTTDRLRTAFVNERRFSAVLVYENVALVALRSLRNQGLPRKAVLRYPQYGVVADHPALVINHKNTQDQIDASVAFKDFLLTPAMQALAVRTEYFRPAIDDLGEEFAGVVPQTFSPFEASGMAMDLQAATRTPVQAPSADLMTKLIDMYRGLQGAQLQ